MLAFPAAWLRAREADRDADNKVNHDAQGRVEWVPLGCERALPPVRKFRPRGGGGLARVLVLQAGLFVARVSWVISF